MSKDNHSMSFDAVITRKNDEQMAREPLLCNGLLRRFVMKKSHFGENSPHNDISCHYEEKQSEQSVKLSAQSDVVIPSKNGRVKKAAFTLTEVLLAVLIVGIIAAMVLPAIITKYQDKVLGSAFSREVHSIQDSINSLVAVENKSTFSETSIATDTGAYMQKYLRVSKYCGTSGKDCFAGKYYEYENHDKKTYTPSFNGSCSILKNGTSVCLSVNGNNIDMLIDVNGPKAPNVLGRDLRAYTYSVQDKKGYNMTSSGVIALNNSPVNSSGDSDSDPDPTPTPDPCAGKTCGCGALPACGVDVDATFTLSCSIGGAFEKTTCKLSVSGTNVSKLTNVYTYVTTQVSGAQSNGSYSNTYTSSVAADNQSHTVCSGYDNSGWYDWDGNPCGGSCPGGYMEEDWERCEWLDASPYNVVQGKEGKVLCSISSLGGHCNYKATLK